MGKLGLALRRISRCGHHTDGVGGGREVVMHPFYIIVCVLWVGVQGWCVTPVIASGTREGASGGVRLVVKDMSAMVR